MKTEIFTDDISGAARLIAQGELVAVPTETVYGLAGSGLDESAVEKIYAVKGRPAVKPLSLMVSGSEAIEEYCEDVPRSAYTLAEKFWPGPLTIVLKAKNNVPDIVRAGGATVGLRCPDHPMTLELIRRASLPLAAPSANPSGEKSPTNAQQVREYFDGQIAGIIDGGECGIGTESTLIDMSRTPYSVLRAGAVSREDIISALRGKLRIVGLTGGTGCGKSTALKTLEDMGALTIDCDEVYHELTLNSGEMLRRIEERFPGVVENGVLQRKKLGSIVFADEEALSDLNSITHSFVGEKVEELLSDWVMRGGTLAAIDAIALIESGIAQQCSETVGVTAPTRIRVERLMARDGISEEYARSRIAAQKDNEYFEKNCDYILDNGGTREEFAEKCRKLFEEILR